MASPGPSCYRTARPEQSNRAEAEENDVKNKFIDFIEIEKSK